MPSTYHQPQQNTGLSCNNMAVEKAFGVFIAASTCNQIFSSFHHLLVVTGLKHVKHQQLYDKIKEQLKFSWRAQNLWAKLDKRAAHRDYGHGTICSNTKVLIIGAGPCGLRTAIECAFLGATTVVVEKRDRFTRNNILHLWPYLITDLKNLGAKMFFGKFGAGSIDHISIRQLQCILLKVALLVGVQVHVNVGFDGLIEPPEDQTTEVGWRCKVDPDDHPVAEYQFDVLIGADGKRNTFSGFPRKMFRGKLAIAITVNFENKHTKAEARVEEISGVAFLFKQQFFLDMKQKTGIDLENIVYYKDDTHYFVMTAKKQSLLNKGVLKQDRADTATLLDRSNVDQNSLLSYASEAADFSTNYQLPKLEFAVNHQGQADAAIFDFTSMLAAENSSRVVERNGHRLLIGLVGDSLLEPFWPTGSGCARGFLGAFDASWMIRRWAIGDMTPLEIIAERESIYSVLSQTTQESLRKDYNQYSINPCTRYPNFVCRLKPKQVVQLYDGAAGGKGVEEDLVEVASKGARSVVNSGLPVQPKAKQAEKEDTIKSPHSPKTGRRSSLQDKDSQPIIAPKKDETEVMTISNKWPMQDVASILQVDKPVEASTAQRDSIPPIPPKDLVNGRPSVSARAAVLLAKFQSNEQHPAPHPVRQRDFKFQVPALQIRRRP